MTMTINSKWSKDSTPYRKALENRLRRVAERQGLFLTKSRRRDTRALDYGIWRLERVAGEGATECVVESNDLYQIAEYLKEDI